MGYTEAELSVLIVDDAEMAEINLEYRQIGHTTDVLSFPMLEGEFADVCTQMLGDVVISADTALSISDETGSAFESVIDLLLVHGILHLLGFNHEAGERQALEMRRKTEELLSLLGHPGAEFGWFFEAGE